MAAPVPVPDLLKVLRADAQYAAHLPQLNELAAQYEAKQVDKSAAIKRLIALIGKPQLLALIKSPSAAAAPAGSSAAAAAVPAVPAVGVKRSLGGGAEEQQQPAKRQREADGGGGDEGNEGPEQAFDPRTCDAVVQAGVNEDAEAAAYRSLSAADGGEPEGTFFLSGAQGKRLQAKLTEIAHKFGLEGGADERALKLVAVALEERMSMVIEPLRSAVLHRTNAAKLSFGKNAVVPSTNPMQSWKKQQEALAQQKAAAAKGGSSGAGTSAAEADDGKPQRRSSGVVTASTQDVLYILDSDPKASKSRVVQWWRAVPQQLDYPGQSAGLFPRAKAPAPAPAPAEDDE